MSDETEEKKLKISVEKAHFVRTAFPRSCLSSSKIIEIPLHFPDCLSLLHPVMTSGCDLKKKRKKKRHRSVFCAVSLRPSLCHDEVIAPLSDVCSGTEISLHCWWTRAGTSSFGLEQVGHKENLQGERRVSLKFCRKTVKVTTD